MKHWPVWKLSLTVLLGTVLAMALTQAADAEDWLSISGEKGFFFNYSSGVGGGLYPWESGFSFTQSLLLELEGEFGNGYQLQGYLADLPNAPGQLFLELTGERSGARFGDGNLNSFTTPLTSWSGDFNGLTAYLNQTNTKWQVAVANPTGLACRESRLVKSGRNYTYLSYQPIQEGSLTVKQEGRLLLEGTDYLIDYYTGKLELLFFPERDLQLDLEYRYAVSEVLGNQFIALAETSQWGRVQAGFDYFGSQTQQQQGPVLLGEVKQPPAFNLAGANLGFKTDNWQWTAEYWASAEQLTRQRWDYLDNMEGEEISAEAFVNTTDPINWFVINRGSGYLNLTAITPAQDLVHTREGYPSLVWNYQLQRNGDAISIYHDFGSDRDCMIEEAFSVWVYGNGQDLQLELQLITNENSYYYHQGTISAEGWQEFRVTLDPLDPAGLTAVGLPDLSKVRYLKLIVTSPIGASLGGQLYFAPFNLITKSLAELRWAETATTPGSSITVTSTAEIVPDQPVDNQILVLDYSLTPVTGWAELTYQPAAVIDLNQYHSLKLYLNPSEPNLSLTISSGRGDQQYLLATIVPTLVGGWQEYEVALTAIPTYVLERLETLTLRVSNSTLATGSLKIDAIRACDRESANAAATKLRGDYQSGAWHNQVEFSNFSPGFRDLTKSYNYETQMLRNSIEFNGEKWQFRSDLQSYQQGEIVNGYPLQGERLEFNLDHQGTNFFLVQSNDQPFLEADPGLTGIKKEVRWGLSQQLANWNLQYQQRRFENSIVVSDQAESDSLTARYQRDSWWATGQLWREDLSSSSLVSLTNGLNLGLGIDPPGVDRFQINGGVTSSQASDGDQNRYFWQSDLTSSLTSWLIMNSSLKQVETPEGDREDLTSDHLYQLALILTPATAWRIDLDQKWRSWELITQGPSNQYTQEYRANYHWASRQKLGFFVRLEDLESSSGSTSGSRYGLNTDLVLRQNWLTQLSTELNRNSGDTVLGDTDQGDYQFSLKNSRRRVNHLFYWGAWAEGTASGSEWERRMGQLGWEKRVAAGWGYGLKVDLGNEDGADQEGLIWGLSSFLVLRGGPNFFELNLRRQTYSNYFWIASLDYRIFRGEIFSVTLHTDYNQDRYLGDNLVARADLLFYLR